MSTESRIASARTRIEDVGAPPIVLVLAAIVSVQIGAAFARTLFSEAGPVGVVMLRLVFGGAALGLLWRPRIRRPKVISGVRRRMRGMGRSGATSAEIEAIYRERFRAFLLTATALLRDGDAALDAVQEGFSVALHRRRSFRREGNLEAWLWRIVLNVARDRLRSLRREGTFEGSTASSEMGSSDDDVRGSLLSLPERQRLAVFLRYYADLSYEQIADALGVRVGTVAAALNAAHTSLRRALQEVVK